MIDLFSSVGMQLDEDLPVSNGLGDVIFTPDWAAADMVRHFAPSGVILEPCRGGGAFMRFLPPDALWCEISEGVDFFDWNTPVDWIITNPPYTKIRQFLKHSIRVSANVVFLVPAWRIFCGYGSVREPAGWGGMAEIRWYGTGGGLGFPMGNAIAAIHWRRGHYGPIHQTFYEDEGRRKA